MEFVHPVPATSHYAQLLSAQREFLVLVCNACEERFFFCRRCWFWHVSSRPRNQFLLAILLLRVILLLPLGSVSATRSLR
jgi:hypothetical protein